MRPTPAEVIAGVRRILKDVVEPSVSSGYARSALDQVRAVLAQVDWNDASTTLAGEADELIALSARAVEWIGVSDARGERFAEAADRLGRLAATTQSPTERFEVRNARVDDLSRALVAFHAELQEWELAPGRVGARALRDRAALRPDGVTGAARSAPRLRPRTPRARPSAASCRSSRPEGWADARCG